MGVFTSYETRKGVKKLKIENIYLLLVYITLYYKWKTIL